MVECSMLPRLIFWNAVNWNIPKPQMSTLQRSWKTQKLQCCDKETGVYSGGKYANREMTHGG